MANLLKKISDLTAGTPLDTDIIPYVDLVAGVTKKALKSELKGDKGDTGLTGATGATGTQGIQGIQGIQGVKGDTGAKGDKGDTGDTGNGITSIVKTGTVGLTDTYTITFTDLTTTTYDVVNGEDGTNGTNGTNGTDGDDAYVYIAYASADDGTDFTLTFNSALNYIAIKTTTTPIASPVASDFTGLWKNYKGATGNTGATGAVGVDWQGAWSAGTYTVTQAVSHNGSSWICTATSTTEEPSISATDWDLIAQKGTDGAGSGDVMGPAGAVADNIAVFDSTTGKLIKDGGKKISELQLALGFTPENVANKSTTLDTDKTSDTKYPSVKSVYDWAVGLFQTLANKVTSFQVTPDDTHYPSEKLVKDSLDAKAPLSSPTFTGTITLPKTLEIQDTSADHQYVLAVNELTADRTVTLPSLTGNDEFVFKDHTQTLSGKRINPRLLTTTSYTTDTGTSLSVATCDQFEVTAQAGALKLNNPGGTPLGGQKLIVRIKDNGTARALTYDTQFRAMGNALPSTTIVNKTVYMGFIFNATDTKWDLVALSQEV